jgi:Domain of unknown function (DUF4129)
MISRQPGVTPPGEGSERGEGASMESALTAQDWLVRLLPVALLIVVGLAGLRGAVGTLRWDGPLHQDAVVLGVVLEVVIVTLFVILLVRSGRGSQEPTAVKLRGVLLLVLGAGGIGAAVLVLAGLNLKGLGAGRRLPPIGHPTATPSISLRPHPGSGSALHFPVTVLLYALLVVVLLAGIAVCIWLARRLRRPVALRDTGDDFIVEDPERLREAVESGRSALRTVDDARAAIIACYLAMETSLAERGTARGVSDTPGELLTRATESGLVRGTAAGRLTALFYEARFSSHPLDHRQRDAAEHALDELAADLAGAGGAGGAERAERAERAEGAEGAAR